MQKHHSPHTQQKVLLQLQITQVNAGAGWEWAWVQDCGFIPRVKGVPFAEDGAKSCQSTEPGGLLEWEKDWMWEMETNN